MKIETEIEKLSEYMDPKELMGLLSKPLEYLIEDVSAIIPSLAIGEDGLSLASIFLFSKNHLCEINIVGQKGESFDFVNKREVINIRFTLGNQDIVVDEQVVASYDTAEVTIVHQPQMASVLHYFGPDRSTWVAKVLKEIPIEYLLRTKCQ